MILQICSNHFNNKHVYIMIDEKYDNSNNNNCDEDKKL